jgi:3,4-dihydroxyphenylacetate 2,3-dioxygenase
MGEIVGAALVGHVPTIMLPEDVRRKLGGGADTTLVSGFATMRERLTDAGADTLLIVDSHWFTTAEHIVAGAPHHSGTYTSEELPRAIRGLAFDYPGAPELAVRIGRVGRERKQWVFNAADGDIAHHYPTLNVVHHVHRGERVLSTGVCQTADLEDFLAFGEVLAAAIAEGDERVAILASGGLSHRFWPLREFRDHGGYDPSHVITPEARAFDERVIELLRAGDHAAVIAAYPDYRAHSPEGHFGHYLTMAGALGGREWTAKGEALSNYESSYGTGQIHIWFRRA